MYPYILCSSKKEGDTEGRLMSLLSSETIHRVPLYATHCDSSLSFLPIEQGYLLISQKKYSFIDLF